MTERRTASSITGRPSGTDKRRRSFWLDPRFAIGLLLVAVSSIGVVSLVAAADTSIEVLTARGPLAPGDLVTAADLIATSVSVGETRSLYLTAAGLPAEGVVLTRPVAAGELVPASAVGSVAGLHLTSVVLSLGSQLPASVAPGSRVDVWSAREIANSTFGVPVVLVPSAIVVRIVDDEGIIVGAARATVEVLIPRFSTARVLDAVANGASLAVVPVDLPLQR